MRFVSFSARLTGMGTAAALVMAGLFVFSTPVTAQTSGDQAATSQSAPAQSSAGQTTTGQSNAGQSATSQGTTADGTIAQSNNGTYIAIDPLAKVRYDNRWDASLGLAYGHIKAGPNLREGANLGGIDLSGSYWLTKHWGLEGSGRGYLGTSGTAPNPYQLDGLFVAQYMFLAGPEYLWFHNKHAALILHGLVGGAYGDFNTDLRGHTPGPAGPAAFYDNQVALGGAFGGHIDLNRSEHWVFRVTPDALMTTYDGTSEYPHTQWNFGISVGLQYKFKPKR